MRNGNMENTICRALKVENIEAWLLKEDLAFCLEAFRKQEISMLALCTCIFTEDEFKQIGISSSTDRKRLTSTIEKLKGEVDQLVALELNATRPVVG